MMRMSKSLCWMGLLIAVVGQGRERNPFQPPPTHCEQAFVELDLWRLSGVLFTKKHAVALVATPKGGKRLYLGRQVLSLAKVIAIHRQQVCFSFGVHCDGAHYSLQGGRHEQKTNSRGTYTDPDALLSPSKP